MTEYTKKTFTVAQQGTKEPAKCLHKWQRVNPVRKVQECVTCGKVIPDTTEEA